MTIRKTGAATGSVTGIDQESPISKTGSLDEGDSPWRSADEQALADENREVDFHEPDERRA